MHPEPCSPASLSKIFRGSPIFPSSRLSQRALASFQSFQSFGRFHSFVSAFRPLCSHLALCIIRICYFTKTLYVIFVVTEYCCGLCCLGLCFCLRGRPWAFVVLCSVTYLERPEMFVFETVTSQKNKRTPEKYTTPKKTTTKNKKIGSF